MYWYILFLLPKHKTPIGILLNYQMEITSIEEMQKNVSYSFIGYYKQYVRDNKNEFSVKLNLFCKNPLIQDN